MSDVINAAGFALVCEFESCKLRAYLDYGGIPTIGWGHTKGVKIGDTCTQAEADAWLREDLVEAAGLVSRYIKVPMNENERSAMISFAYNVKGFSTSNIVKMLNAGQKGDVPAALMRWDHAHVGAHVVELAGLKRRRAAEASLFVQPVETRQAPEETGASTATAAPSTTSKTTIGTAIAAGTAAGKEAIDNIQPIHDGLSALGFSPEWIAIALGVLFVGATAYVLYRRWQVRHQWSS